MYDLFTLDSRACLVLSDCGVWLSLGCWFWSHWVVSQSCLVSLLHIHFLSKPISTGSTRKTHSLYLLWEQSWATAHTRWGSVPSVVALRACVGWRGSPAQLFIMEDRKALHFKDAFWSKWTLQTQHSLREFLCCPSQVGFYGVLGAALFPLL